jgi:hypothetical protein
MEKATQESSPTFCTLTFAPGRAGATSFRPKNASAGRSASASAPSPRPALVPTSQSLTGVQVPRLPVLEAETALLCSQVPSQTPKMSASSRASVQHACTTTLHPDKRPRNHEQLPPRPRREASTQSQLPPTGGEIDLSVAGC